MIEEASRGVIYHYVCLFFGSFPMVVTQVPPTSWNYKRSSFHRRSYPVGGYNRRPPRRSTRRSEARGYPFPEVGGRAPGPRAARTALSNLEYARRCDACVP